MPKESKKTILQEIEENIFSPSYIGTVLFAVFEYLMFTMDPTYRTRMAADMGSVLLAAWLAFLISKKKWISVSVGILCAWIWIFRVDTDYLEKLRTEGPPILSLATTAEIEKAIKENPDNCLYSLSYPPTANSRATRDIVKAYYDAGCRSQVASTEPQKIRTELQLQFYGGQTVPTGMKADNVLWWYAYAYPAQGIGVDKNNYACIGQALAHMLFLVFDKPVKTGQILVSFSGGFLPAEVKQQSSRHAVVFIGADIPKGVLTVSVKPS